MWELIRKNRLKSIVFFFLMFLLLAGIGGSFGYYYGGIEGGLAGIAIAVALWLFLSASVYFFGDKIVLSSAHATLVTPGDFPKLYNVVQEMKISAGWPYMPELYVINDEAMNAFATGIRKEKTAIAVTAGLLENLNRDELQGVIAHEFGHIINRDVLFMTFSGVMFGCISLLANWFQRSLFYGSSRRSKLSSSGGKNPGLIALSLLLAVLAPLFAQIFYFAISRKREYLADATAVRLTRYPEGLASALEKISMSATNLVWHNKITAPLFIINPQGIMNTEAFVDIMSTHPPTHERIRILRALSGAGFREYQSAYSRLIKKDFAMLPESALQDKTPVPLRQASADSAETGFEKRQTVRTINDLLLAANGFFFLPCTCGLKIKVPPTIGKSNIQCPRCGKYLLVPSLTSAVNHETQPVSGNTENEPPLSYKRVSDGWESFLCKCGHQVQLSPLFKARFIICKKCGRKITIQS